MREREEEVTYFLRCIAEREAEGLTYWVVDDHDTMRIDLHKLAASLREALAAATRATALVDENHPETPERSTRVTDEMVERAAKAMCDDAARFGGSVAPWHMSRENERNSWRESALTVLTAALEGPNDE